MLPWMPAWLSHPLWLFVLATPVQFWAGWPFYQGLWSTLQHRTADMNTLIALGTSAAYLYSVVATFLPGLFAVGHGVHVHVYYETSVVIITLILLGRLLEARARGQTWFTGVTTGRGAPRRSSPTTPRPAARSP